MWRWLFGRKTQASEPSSSEEPEALLEPTQLALDGVLDLHTFRPEEVADLVNEYVLACQAHGVLALRIVHGKGKGTLRRTVHAVLDGLPEVVLAYHLAEPSRGGWGATLVELKPQKV